MLIIPAIDIINREVVRLEKGAFKSKVTYSLDPVEVAAKWKALGARLIHVVDLDGARTGRPANLSIISRLVKEVDVELGGGLRREEDVEAAFEKGVKFVVLGTKAATDDEFSKKLISRFGERVIFSVDVKDDMVALKGWQKISEMHTLEYIKKLERIGAKRIIYTDISKDGMMAGPNLEALRIILQSTDIRVIASGGVTTLDDLKALKALEKDGLAGAIIGKALYEGKIDLKEALSVG